MAKSKVDISDLIDSFKRKAALKKIEPKHKVIKSEDGVIIIKKNK